MNDPTIRETASLITVVSLAIIAIMIALLPPLWNGFERRFLSLPRNERIAILKVHLIVVSPITFLLIAINLGGIYVPSSINAIIFLAFLSLNALMIIIFVVISLKRLIDWFRHRSHKVNTINTLGLLYLSTIGWIVICIIFCLFGIIGVSATMLDITIGFYGAENYSWGKWMLFDGILFFLYGVMMFGITYLENWLENKRNNLYQLHIE